VKRLKQRPSPLGVRTVTEMNQIRLVVFFLLCLSSVSCQTGEVVDVVVSETPLRLSPTTSVIECDPPLARTHRSASLFLDLTNDWRPEAPWDHIVVEDLGNVSLTAILVTSSGREITSAILGSAGKYLNIRFDPELPKDEQIRLIRLDSSDPLDVRRIIWHNFDSK